MKSSAKKLSVLIGFFAFGTSVDAMEFSEEYKGLNREQLTRLEMDRPFHPPLKAELARVSGCAKRKGLAIHYLNWLKVFAQLEDRDLAELKRFESMLLEDRSSFEREYCTNDAVKSASVNP